MQQGSLGSDVINFDIFPEIFIIKKLQIYFVHLMRILLIYKYCNFYSQIREYGTPRGVLSSIFKNYFH